jgi:membrane-bound ClpP family serine protease
MWWIYVLMLIFGILLILMEAVTPHGISFFFGAAIVIASIWLCIAREGFDAGVIYIIFAGALATLVSVYVFRSGINVMALKAPRDSFAEKLAQEGRETPPPLGAKARVAQPLHPTGTIEWQGRRLPARALQLEKEVGVGEWVVVRGRDSIYYLVETAMENELAAAADVPHGTGYVDHSLGSQPNPDEA